MLSENLEQYQQNYDILEISGTYFEVFNMVKIIYYPYLLRT